MLSACSDSEWKSPRCHYMREELQSHDYMWSHMKKGDLNPNLGFKVLNGAGCESRQGFPLLPLIDEAFISDETVLKE